MAFEAASLAVISPLHLSGTLAGESKPFDSSHASIAEALICVVLVAGVATLLLGRPRARTLAAAATGFAILGFVVGLTFSIRGGDTIDVAYHATVLPLLLLTLAALV